VRATVLAWPSVVEVAGGLRGGDGRRDGCLSTAMMDPLSVESHAALISLPLFES